MYFNIESGSLCCKDCNPDSRFTAIDRSMLSALRHIVYSDFSKLYSFEVSEKTADRLSDLTERYILTQSEQRFSALDFYRSIKNI